MLKQCFNESKWNHFKNTHELSLCASEMLSLLPAFLLFLQSLPEIVHLHNEIESFSRLCKCVGLWSLVKDCHIDLTDAWANAFFDHAGSYAAAYGADEHYVPKFHFCRHLPFQVHRDGMELDALTPERYHQVVKACALNVTNTSCFERTVMGRVLVRHLSMLNAEGMFQDILIRPSSAPSLGAGAQYSRQMTFRQTLLSDSDLLIIDGTPNFAHGFFERDEITYALLEACDFVHHVTPASALWVRSHCIESAQLAFATSVRLGVWVQCRDLEHVHVIRMF